MLALDVGYVYVMVNPAIPGYVKIGLTRRDPKQRAKDLFTTSIPEAWRVFYQQLVPNCVDVERSVHRSLSQYRPNKKREFFKIDPEVGVKYIERFADANIQAFPGWPDISEVEKIAEIRAARRREVTSLLEREQQRTVAEATKKNQERERQAIRRKYIDDSTRKIIDSGAIGLGPIVWSLLFASQYGDGKERVVVFMVFAILLVGLISRSRAKRKALETRKEHGLPDL